MSNIIHFPQRRITTASRCEQIVQRAKEMAQEREAAAAAESMTGKEVRHLTYGWTGIVFGEKRDGTLIVRTTIEGSGIICELAEKAALLRIVQKGGAA